MAAAPDITQLLLDAGDRSPSAVDALFVALYDDLRRIAPSACATSRPA
ncbi:MAG: hypothetical protein U0704_06925 [Candidatus Eisenbacteria bacterium]